MRDNGIIKILMIVFGVLDVAALVAVIIMATSSGKIKNLQLTADFPETEIGVSSEYTFTISATPSKASTKKVECECDDPSAEFEITKDGKAVLKTGATEGTVTVYVKYKKIESNKLTFNVVDLVARAQAEAEAAAAAAQAEAEAAAAEQAAAEAEAAAAEVKQYVMMTGDNVNVRAQNNTDCDILGKAKKGEKFEKVEEVDDWTHIMYNGQDGYIKTEYLQGISEDEYLNGGNAAANDTATQDKKEETANNAANDEAAKKAAEDAAKQAADEAAKKAAEEAAAAQAAQELAAQQAAAAAAAAAAGPSLECADGVHTFTSAQYNFLKGFWYREGQTSADDWKAYAHKHTYAECIQICQIEGGL